MRWVITLLSCVDAPGAAARRGKTIKITENMNFITRSPRTSRRTTYSKALTDLDRWSEKYPDSEFKDDRQMLYVQAYSGANQWAKTIDVAGRGAVEVINCLLAIRLVCSVCYTQ